MNLPPVLDIPTPVNTTNTDVGVTTTDQIQDPQDSSPINHISPLTQPLQESESQETNQHQPIISVDEKDDDDPNFDSAADHNHTHDKLDVDVDNENKDKENSKDNEEEESSEPQAKRSKVMKEVSLKESSLSQSEHGTPEVVKSSTTGSGSDANSDNSSTHNQDQVDMETEILANNNNTHISSSPTSSIALAHESKWSRNGYGQPCPIPPRGGKFTPEETALVRAAITEYCMVKNISVSRLCSECDHKSELKGAWMEISKQLPHRTVQSVYRHGLRQLHPFKRGPWTEAECTTLANAVKEHGKKWSTIQSKLNRSADSCRDKHREMSTEYVKGRWKDEECELLKRLVRDFLKVSPTADIVELGQFVEQQKITIPWSRISKQMGKRSRLSCFKKWQKMTIVPPPNSSPNTTMNSAPNMVTNSSTLPNKHNKTTQKVLSNKSNLLKLPPQSQPDPQQQSHQILPEATMDMMETALSVSAMTIPTLSDAEPNSNTVSSLNLPPLSLPLPDATITTTSENPNTNIVAVHSDANPKSDTHDSSIKSPTDTDMGPTTNTNTDTTQILSPKTDNINVEEYDLFLLQQISDLGATTTDPLPWDTLRHPLGAMERWNTLLLEMQDELQNGFPANGTSLSPSSMAQWLLERKKINKADVVVEAIDLPMVGPLSNTIGSTSTDISTTIATPTAAEVTTTTTTINSDPIALKQDDDEEENHLNFGQAV